MIDEEWLADVEDIYALSPLQLGMLFQTRLAPNSGVFFQQVATVLDPIDVDAFEQSWQAVVDRTPALRTSFQWAELDHPVQVVHRNVRLRVERGDWSDLSPEALTPRLEAHLAEVRFRGFDLNVAPLMRVEVMRLARGRCYFVWHFHHMLLDGWSSQLLLQELIDEYTARRRKQVIDPPSRPPFSTYIAWLQRQDDVAAERYWKSVLQGFTEPTALGIGREGGRPSADGSTIEHVVECSETSTSQLLAFARTNRVTMNTVVQGAWALLLSRYSGDRDVMFGSVVSGRPPELSGVEDIIGLFINSLPTRIVVDPDAGLVAWLRGIQGQQVEATRYDYASPMEISQWSDLPPGTKPYSSVLIFENYPTTLPEADADGAGTTGSRDVGTTDVPLSVMVVPGTVLRLTFRADGHVMGEDDVQRIARHLIDLLARLPAAADRPLRAIALASHDECRRVVSEWNDTATSGWSDTALTALFGEQVERTPNATAFVEESGGRITFAGLHELSSRMANHMIERGVAPGDVVGVHLPRSIDAAVSLLAILKAGAAYLPLDPVFPPLRLARMVSDARAVLVVTTGWPGGGGQVPVLDLVKDRDAVARCHDHAPTACAGLNDLAYVLFTSGSTGAPKGVAVEHRTLLNRLWWMWRTFPFEPAETGVVRTSLNFVDSLWELLGPLLRGVPSVLASHDTVVDPRAFVELAAAHGVTRVFFVPSYLEALLEVRPDVGARVPALRMWFSGGEVLTTDLCRRFGRAAPSASLYNTYGASELWDATLAHASSETVVNGRCSVGRPIANTRAYILDLDQNPVPVGVTGRLHIAGAGLARGYLDGTLTRERFVMRSIVPDSPERVFDTGDLALYRNDGTIEVVGRRDQQLKLRGHRIEPGEVESVMQAHSDVEDAAVTLRMFATGDERLVAYAVSAVDNPDEDAVLASMAEALPAYMVPYRIVWLKQMPRTRSGKKDRRQLPQWSEPRTGDRTVQLDTDELTLLIAETFADLLGLDSVGPDDHFFGDLGGHSLLAVRVCSRLGANLEVEIPLRMIFDHPTVKSLVPRVRSVIGTPVNGAASLQRKEAPEPNVAAISPGTNDDTVRTGKFPLSFAQERMWFLDQLTPGNASYNLSFAFQLGYRVDHGAVEWALSALVVRHEALRTTFPLVGDEAAQRVGHATAASCPVHDLRAVRSRQQATELEQLVASLAGQPFDLANGPLFRCALVRTSGLGDVFVLVMHHIIADGWSLEIIFRDLAALYREAATERPASLPAIQSQYADYTLWQRSQLTGPVLERLLAYWRRALDGVPILEMPTDRARPAVQSPHGGQLRFQLSAATVAAMRRVVRESDTTAFTVLLAAFVTLLHRYTSQDDVVVGTPVASRNRIEFEGAVGFFANTLVLRTNLSGNPSFNEVIRRVRTMTMDAYEHQDLPFSKLVSAIRPKQDLSRNPLFQVSFQLLSPHTAQQASVADDGRTSAVPFEQGTAIFDLALNMAELGSSLTGQFGFSTDLFDATTIEALRDHFVTLLDDACARPDAPICDLELLPDEEHGLLDDWTAGLADDSGALTVCSMFEEQLGRSPHAVAVKDDTGELSYSQLDARAAHLSQLIGARVGHGGSVAILMRPTTDVVVALLAVLKSGNAFVPLATDLPVPRQEAMLHDAGVCLMLTQSALVDQVPPGAETLIVDAWEGAIESGTGDHVPGADAGLVIEPSDVAYVMFTSGSSGRPKGVVVTHRSLANYLRWCARTYPMAEGVGAPLASSIASDMSLTTIFAPLTCGKTVFLLDDRDLVEALDTALRGSETFSFVKLTPSHLLALSSLSLGRAVPANTRALVVGGEALRGEMLAPWRAAAPDMLLWNEYGPTEATVACCAYRSALRSVGDGPVPIGWPITDTTAEVFDPHGRRVPLGVPGELWIGGVAVAKGYLGDGVPGEPFVGVQDRRYRSGDLVRRRRDGTLEYLGRMDRQLKIRGHRVEPGDVESVLARHPDITASVVFARDVSHGDRRLIAAVVAADGAALVTLPSELAAFARRELPAPMVPQRFIVVDTLPLTRSGKVDLDALERRDSAPACPPRATEPEVPRTSLERVIALVFSDVLLLDEIAAGDHFFAELGGDSLLATKVVARLRQYLTLEFPLRLLFENPTVTDLAHALLAEADGDPPLERLAELLFEVLELTANEVDERLATHASEER